MKECTCLALLMCVLVVSATAERPEMDSLTQISSDNQAFTTTLSSFPKLGSGDISLFDYPFIMTHDAATGYLGSGIVENWAKTQSAGFGNQLKCGARSFDIRPYAKDGKVFFHHGDVQVWTNMSYAFSEIMNWCAQNPSELVLLYINKCDGDTNCWNLVRQESAALQLTWISPSTNCFAHNTTYAQAHKMGSTLRKGGSALIVEEDCMLENYDPNVECYLTQQNSYFPPSSSSNASDTPNDKSYVCYDPATSTVPVERFNTYMSIYTRPRNKDSGMASATTTSTRMSSRLQHNPLHRRARSESELRAKETYLASLSPLERDTANAYLASQQQQQQQQQQYAMQAGAGRSLWMAQAHWQYSTTSVVAGLLHGSSILIDSEKSKVNARLAQNINAGVYKWINILEVDHVCQDGPSIYAALHNKK